MKISWVETESNRTISQVLKQDHGLSRRQLIRLKQQPGSVLIDHVPVFLNAIPKSGQTVTVTLREHLESLIPEEIPLDIVYEDEYIIVINKPAGMVAHPTKGYKDGTLANALAHHWQGARPARLVTRLDKDTSGLVLAAKSAWSHHRLSQTQICKEYLALTRGVPNPLDGEISAPLGRDSYNPNRRGVDPQGKKALTKYRVERVNGDLALVRLWPITGRTHQLRLHLAHIGCPLVDDFMYGQEEGLVGRTALHAHKLNFPHPYTEKALEFQAPLSTDMSRIINTSKQ